MGYRNYIYVVRKDRADDFRRMGIRALEDIPGSCHISINDTLDAMGAVEAYELGKDVDVPLRKGLKPFFMDAEVHTNITAEHEFMLMEPDLLQTFATHYKKKAMVYNKRLLADYNKDKSAGGKKLYEALKYRTSMMSTIDNLGDNPFCLVDTWLYDYDLLNFMFLLKTVDFDKYYLLWLGW